MKVARSHAQNKLGSVRAMRAFMEEGKIRGGEMMSFDSAAIRELKGRVQHWELLANVVDWAA